MTGLNQVPSEDDGSPKHRSTAPGGRDILAGSGEKAPTGLRAWMQLGRKNVAREHEDGDRDGVEGEEEKGLYSEPGSSCPMERASILSQLFWTWVNPVIRAGIKRQLSIDDMFPIPERDKASRLGARLEQAWESANQRAKERGRPPPQLWRLAIWELRWRILGVMVLILAESGQRILSAVVVRQLILFLQKKEGGEVWQGYLYALALGALGMIYAILHHQLWNCAQQQGWNLRVACMTLVNRKLLSMNAGSLARTTTGHCINLMSNDVRRFDDLLMFAHFLWASPLELLAVAVLIARELGLWPALAGICTLVSLIPLQAAFGRSFAKRRVGTAKYTDRRVKMTGEILNGILAVKMFAWEPAFASSIDGIRKEERKNIVSASMIKAFNEASFFSGSAIVAFVTFATFRSRGGHLNPSSVFYTVALLQLPRLWMCIFFPNGIQMVAESTVSFSRLQKFLLLAEPRQLKVLSGSVSNADVASRPSSKSPGKSAECQAGDAADDTAHASGCDHAMSAVANGGNSLATENGEQMSSNEDLPAEGRVAVSMRDCTFSWSQSEDGIGFDSGAGGRKDSEGKGKDVGDEAKVVGGSQEGSLDNGLSLKHLSFKLGPEELLGVTGRVGSGKSSLLAAILGELNQIGGELVVNARRTAYAPQKPFIIAGTLRENVVFGAPWDESRYNDVIDACVLRRDIALLPHGDLTEIGERGINLSGGQKARVGIARAAYVDADLVLLDDPLSAVDPSVGRHLFEKCITGFLRGKPIILVTHQLQYLPKCDRVLLLKEGEMADVGTFEELHGRVDFHGFVDMGDEDGQPADTSKASQTATNGDRPGKETADEAFQVEDGGSMASRPMKKTAEVGEESSQGKGGALVETEARVEGVVTWRVYAGYVYNIGIVSSVILFCLMTAGQAVLACSDGFLAYWSSQKDQGQPLMLIYLGLVLGTVLISFFRAGLFFRCAIAAASRIHQGMLSSVLAAPLSFFHANPIGRVLNRFSADQGVMDDMLPQTLFNCLQTIFVCIGALVVTAIGVPYVLLSLPFLLFVFLHFRNRFVATSRETKRLEAVTRSPVYAHFASALQGLSTIRAFRAQAQFDKEFMDKLDENGRGYFAWMVSSRWLAVRMDGTSAVVLLLTGVIAVLARDTFSPALVGLALTYTLQLTGMLQWAVRQTAEVENLFTGVERALEYTKLPSEGPRRILGHVPPPDWPDKGAVSVVNLTVRYRPGLPPVLDGVSFELRGGEKCGIVGRTGAGKSTLMLALFRLVDVPLGNIRIDAIDIATIGLADLRSKVAAIPQDPVLFGNSVRFNLDPFGLYQDAQLWEALDDVRLKTKVAALQSGLDSSMAEFGENFSVGERQLCCLARAILQESRVLVMDEATANVDLETDELIQRTLRERFALSTVLMIAHRMDTVIDADLILLLHHGKAIEFGPPADLLAQPDGAFSAMVRKTGQASEAILRRKASMARPL